MISSFMTTSTTVFGLSGYPASPFFLKEVWARHLRWHSGPVGRNVVQQMAARFKKTGRLENGVDNMDHLIPTKKDFVPALQVESVQ